VFPNLKENPPGVQEQQPARHRNHVPIKREWLKSSAFVRFSIAKTPKKNLREIARFVIHSFINLAKNIEGC
jgi:hypothetical protein